MTYTIIIIKDDAKQTIRNILPQVAINQQKPHFYPYVLLTEEELLILKLAVDPNHILLLEPVL